MMAGGRKEMLRKPKCNGTQNLCMLFWPVVSAFYLLVSFLSGAWNVTWMILPAALISFRFFYGLVKEREEK